MHCTQHVSSFGSCFTVFCPGSLDLKEAVMLSLVHNTSHSYASRHVAAIATICEHSTVHESRRAARIDPSSKLAAQRGAEDAARPCMYVCPLISAASHIGITNERYQRIHRNTGIILKFADLPKNASFKSYGVIYLPRAAPASSSCSSILQLFSPQSKLLC